MTYMKKKIFFFKFKTTRLRFQPTNNNNVIYLGILNLTLQLIFHTLPIIVFFARINIYYIVHINTYIGKFCKFNTSKHD